MFDRVFRRFGLTLLMGVFILCWGLSSGNVERTGDRIQIALPLAGLACAAASGDAIRYFGRFLLLTGVGHGTKSALADHPINARPHGGHRGFPSGHTWAAAFGATGLLQTCLAANRPAQAAAVFGAGFVGASRIEAGAHTVWQVIAGAILGWWIQIAALSRFDRAVRYVARKIGHTVAYLAGSLFGVCAYAAVRLETIIRTRKP